MIFIDCKKITKDYKNALLSYEASKKNQDSSSKKINVAKINELRIIHKTEQKEAEIVLQQKEIKTLNQEVEIGNLKKSLYTGGMASALALFGLSVFGFDSASKRTALHNRNRRRFIRRKLNIKRKS